MKELHVPFQSAHQSLDKIPAALTQPADKVAANHAAHMHNATVGLTKCCEALLILAVFDNYRALSACFLMEGETKGAKLNKRRIWNNDSQEMSWHLNPIFRDAETNTSLYKANKQTNIKVKKRRSSFGVSVWMCMWDHVVLSTSIKSYVELRGNKQLVPQRLPMDGMQVEPEVKRRKL